MSRQVDPGGLQTRASPMTRTHVLTVALAGAVMLTAGGAARAEELPKGVQEAVNTGLQWLAQTQSRDGHWEANGGQYPTSMTALGGMCLLMEGSTLREGKYADNIHRAVNWLMQRCQPSGLIGNPLNPTEASRYMYGHGF